MNNPEKISFGHESNKEALDRAGAERREALRQHFEKIGEHSPDRDTESARHEALETATSIEQEKKERSPERSPAERRKDGPVNKVDREASFKATMHEVQSQMSAPSRTFSKIIHNKAIEKISDVTGNTIARPNAILSGAVCAFLLTLGVYLVAKNYGYPLSGFETIGAFALGWLIGTAYDFLRVMITGRSS